MMSWEPWQQAAALMGAADVLVAFVVGWCCLVMAGRTDDGLPG